jgi:hypothetical protein
VFDLQAGFFDERFAASGGHYLGARGGQAGGEFAAEAGGASDDYGYASG